MAQRGRKSIAALQVAVVGPIESTPRPEAPAALTLEQAVEWDRVVNRLPAEWFPDETHAMLAQYCRHVVAARHIAQLINSIEDPARLPLDGPPDFDLEKYDLLLKLQERETRALSSLATRMRITQQATVRQELARKPRAAKKPWE